MALHSDISLLHSSCRHPEALTHLLHLLANLVGLNSDLANDLMDTDLAYFRLTLPAVP
eukprot:CAMPEP_0175894206 /NCGR_PEP_ID=MMETSP0107_2-20121207/49867_1 /TAXON_ID=195067 ORGANISM="Goniomonas pacifica, Strain CCMP1869" /NCGR_SAMPLE_ID=MMETSP0107_2 /ASSEMBLY_ACC=CAM_ASM_000203 /LENGTH=57 /DNA_ID=CAMNT_0017215281 /DNA_START=407 /DNA_END=580 /DNA_ORIENTATION=-